MQNSFPKELLRKIPAFQEHFFVLLCWISFLCGCSEASREPSSIPSLSHAFIVCEGNYGSNNATLSVLDSVVADTTFNDVFYSVNKRKLGDYARAMLVIDSLGFITVTHSGKIEVINTRTFDIITTLENLPSPRNIARWNDKLLVTLYDDSTVVSFNFLTLTPDFLIKLKHRPDEIAVMNNKAYISNAPNLNDSIISVLDLTTLVTDTLRLTHNPVSVVADPARNRVYVACAGKGSGGYVAVIDAANGVVVGKIGEFNNIKPVKTILQDSLLAYITSANGSIQVYNLNQSTVIANLSGNYHALAFGHRELFATDGLDFISNGDLVWFSSDFKIRRKFKVGRSPAWITFN